VIVNVVFKKSPALIALSCVALIVMGGLVFADKLPVSAFITFVTGLGLPSLLGADDAKDGAK